MPYIRLIAFMFFAMLSPHVHAQKKATPMPKVSTLLGQYKDTVRLNKEEVINIIGMPLRIVDDKRVVYSIASYHVAYRRKAFVEDEETGKVKPTFSLAAERFVNTPLNEIWINSIRSQIQSGEEILFFDIIVKSPDGKVMFAPNFKIIVI
ncbi:MAG TPA: hypothetical protein PKY29_07540 [Ferruginibacter sp.]|nr:hypothetical protein [Ferruginibacter sp.]HRO18554.1 hypothetical protein [Ferruginibacter sp.]HRQ21150.1 hypothetical protein [Ferruginibacter sp.]